MIANKENTGRAEGIVGVVLAGGLSVRMGTDKAQLRLHKHADVNFLESSTKLLAALVPTVWISCRAGQSREGICIYDIYENCGPCGALYTALYHAAAQGFEAVLILACDMPLMNVAMLQKLIKKRQLCTHTTPEKQNLLTTFLHEETGRMQSLAAIYEVAALPFFAHALQKKQYKISCIIPETQRTAIAYTKNEACTFVNCNYPEDLKNAQKIGVVKR